LEGYWEGNGTVVVVAIQKGTHHYCSSARMIKKVSLPCYTYISIYVYIYIYGVVRTVGIYFEEFD